MFEAMGPRKGCNWKEMQINNGVFIKIEEARTFFYADMKDPVQPENLMLQVIEISK